MKKVLSFGLALLLLLTSTPFTFADTLQVNNEKIPNSVTTLSKELNSTPVQLNDGSYFIPDNRAETINKLAKEEILARKNGVAPLSTGIVQYGYAVKNQSLPTPTGYSCTVQATAYVKVIYEYSVYRFLECQSVNWIAMGSNSYQIQPPNGNYNISGDGRYLNVSGAFNIETAVSVSAGPSFGAAGWSVGVSVGGTVIVRRFEYPSFQFDGNYPGAIIH